MIHMPKERCKKRWVSEVMALVLVGFIVTLMGGEFYSPGAAAFEHETEKPSVTHHTITIDGKTMDYTATAGFVPIYEKKTGKDIAHLFYVSYTRDGVTDLGKQPVTFAFNGGPGVASMLLHLGAFGPRTVAKSLDGTQLLPPPYGVEDNENTLLDMTDMVFIDPVGTGYSHAVGDIDPHQFWGVMEDVNSVAEFIRAYLTENGRMLSPVCIAGESYGGTRAAGLVKVLQDNGIYPSGIICVSPVFDFENIQWSSLGDRAIALAIPTYAAAAWYYKKISSRLQGDLEKTLEEVRKWTNDEYVPALWKGNMLSPEVRKKIVDRLVEYTGLSPEYIDRMNLRVTEDDFATELLKDQGRAIGIYDVRVSFPGVYADEDDPSFFILTGPFKTSIADYFQKELQFTTDQVYLSGSGEVYEQWNWQSGRPAPKYAGTVTLGFPDISALLVQAMRRCGFLKVFIASGVYDLECPYESVTYSINHFNLPAERKQNISLHLYSGGHMIYTNPEAHRVLKQDLVDFYRQVLGTKNQ